MRVLLTSDLHYELRQYDWLIAAAAAFDAVVVAGDHIDAMLPVPTAVQIAALAATFGAVAAKSRLFVCSGNHDLNARNAEGEKTADWLGQSRGERLAVDGDTVATADTLFTVCPWWDGPHARARSAVLCGHIHEAPFKADGSWIDRVGDTWLFNAGRQIGDVPARVEIDFARHAARWVSLAGIDERSLQ
jgi:predicted phosphodiesterase